MVPKAVLVVISWNGWNWLEPCLRSLLQTDYPGFRVLVVDNASQDGTVGRIRATFPDVEVLAIRRNLGFAGGCNAGIARGLAEGARYVVLLNQDIVVRPDWLRALIRAGEADPRVGVLSPFQYDYKVEALDPVFGRLIRDNTTFFQDQERGEVARSYEVPTVIGAAMALRREVVERIGVFDPIYFAYFEEKDLCRRTRLSGFRLAVVPESRIGHWHGQVHADQSSADVDGLFLRNRQIYLLKDPAQPFWKNLYVYLRYGLPGSLLGRYDAPLRHPGLLVALRIQAGVLAQIPRIACSRRMDIRRIDGSRAWLGTASAGP